MEPQAHRPYERFGRAIMILILCAIFVALMEVRGRQTQIMSKVDRNAEIMRTWQTSMQVEQALRPIH